MMNKGKKSIINFSFCVLVNFEDHLRISLITDTGDIAKQSTKMHKLLGIFDKKEGFAYDHNLGFLSVSPKNLGTGIKMKATVDIFGGSIPSDELK